MHSRDQDRRKCAGIRLAVGGGWRAHGVQPSARLCCVTSHDRRGHMHTAEESTAAVSQLCARCLRAMGGAPSGLAGARSRGTIDKACRRIRAVPAACLRKLADKFSSRGCGQRHLHPRHFPQLSSHGLSNNVCAAAGVFATGTFSALLDPSQRRKQQTLPKKADVDPRACGSPRLANSASAERWMVDRIDCCQIR